MFRYLPSVLGLLFALPILALIALALEVPITISGIAYLIGCSLAITGLILSPWGGRYPLLILVSGVAVLAFVAGTRLILGSREGSSRIRMVTLPNVNEARWINYLIDEQDSLIFGEAIFHRIGGASTREHEQITAALQAAYAEMRSRQPIFASPFISTYLNRQRPSSFDAVIIAPKTMHHPETAIIFLHGYMGNVTAQCWEIAQAVAEFGAVTVCPSTDWTGSWWQPGGEAILQATFRYLREHGIEEFYLGGFSNGGFGISRLVSKLKVAEGLRGLFFINGISDGTTIRETGLPVLIVQGTQDERVPVEAVRSIAESMGNLDTYVEIEGDHFMIMKQPEPVQRAVADWLESLESNP